jgi:flagellar motor switch protein FliM
MLDTAERANIEAHLRSAAKIEPERLAGLKLLAENWAEASAERLNAVYAAPVVIEFAGLSAFNFSATAPDVASAVLATTVKSSKWRETGFILAEAGLANALVEAMFGGSGLGEPAGARPMTKLDRSFVEVALATFVEAANPIFETVAPLDITSGEVLAGSIGAALDERLLLGGRAFLMLAFTVSVGRLKSTVRFALPEKAIMPHRRKLSIVPEEKPFTDEGWAREIEEGLSHADLEVRALLDEKQITLGEVARFTLGQTIVLNATMESLIVIECEEQRLFRGRMGVQRDAYVVRIEERVDPTEEFIDDILAD